MLKKTLHTILIFLFITLLASNTYSQTYKIGCIEDYYPYTTINKNGELQGIIIDWWNL